MGYDENDPMILRVHNVNLGRFLTPLTNWEGAMAAMLAVNNGLAGVAPQVNQPDFFNSQGDTTQVALQVINQRDYFCFEKDQWMIRSERGK